MNSPKRILLNQEGSQKSLFTNIWLIYTKNVSMKAEHYFVENQFRFGLNVNLFFIKSSPSHYNYVIQILGLGTHQVKYEVRQILFYASDLPNHFIC